MDIDWSFAKKKALWHYEELTGKLHEIFSYSFVHEYYNHNMPDAAIYSQRLQDGYILNGKKASFISAITTQFKALNHIGVKDYIDFIDRIKDKQTCERFLQKSGWSFESLVELLNYLFRWVLPFKGPIRELVQTIPWSGEDYLPILKKFKIRFNLDILENCRTRKGREFLMQETAMDKQFILILAHRADISRLAYVRGNTVKHLFGAGYDTLEKIANADKNKMYQDMTAYFSTTGKNFDQFKAVIPLDWMIGGARVLPRIIG
jgi:hypothetical protein